MGWVLGVEVDRTGNVWILDTCGGWFQDCLTSTEPPVLKFDVSGTFGGGMVVHPHARDGTVTSFVPDPNPAGAQELVVVAPDGTMYTGYTIGRSVKKYIKH